MVRVKVLLRTLEIFSFEKPDLPTNVWDFWVRYQHTTGTQAALSSRLKYTTIVLFDEGPPELINVTVSNIFGLRRFPSEATVKKMLAEVAESYPKFLRRVGI